MSKERPSRPPKSVSFNRPRQVGEHCYRYNIIGADSWYERLLGMPWNKENFPAVY